MHCIGLIENEIKKNSHTPNEIKFNKPQSLSSEYNKSFFIKNILTTDGSKILDLCSLKKKIKVDSLPVDEDKPDLHSLSSYPANLNLSSFQNNIFPINFDLNMQNNLNQLALNSSLVTSNLSINNNSQFYSKMESCKSLNYLMSLTCDNPLYPSQNNILNSFNLMKYNSTLGSSSDCLNDYQENLRLNYLPNKLTKYHQIAMDIEMGKFTQHDTNICVNRPLNLNHPENNKIVNAMIELHGPRSIMIVNDGYGIKNPLYTKQMTDICPSDYIINNLDNTYSCRACKTKCDNLKLLYRHLKCHSQIKRFICSLCFKGFNDTFDLKRHTRTHTGVRPYECIEPGCDKKFSQRCSLESHQKKLHGIKARYSYKQRRRKLYICEICGFSAQTSELHLKHKATVHNKY
ncbi:putative transcription factor ovo-like protein 3 [Intoshia linei]|uniref:Putative transcription factor ovo-like protein 3 n=1 Tax=Intoshia linei TaxID=1819745 RepID=A0A177B4Y3_9BILA|nr:putative transcription factor ovo-like protein 3 [Intoshia linei]